MDLTVINQAPSLSFFKKNPSRVRPNNGVGPSSDWNDLQISIITTIEGFEALEPEWKELACKSDTTIFQTYEWNRIWWTHFGNSKKLHIVSISSGNKLIGLVPLFKDDVSFLGRKAYSCFRFLGSHVSDPAGEPLTGRIPYSDYLDFILLPGYEQLVSTRILDHFNETLSDVDEILLDEVPEESAIRKTMIPLLSRGAHGLSYKIERASSSPVILLKSTWDAYLDSMNAKERYNTRRYFNRSKPKNGKGFTIKKVTHPEGIPGVLTDLMNMHQKQWNHRGFPGTFSEKRMRDFMMEITTSFHKKGWVEFDMAVPLTSEGDYAAIDMMITYNRRVCLMHRCMSEDPLLRRQGPGNVLLYTRINRAFNDGDNVFDMLRGSEDYKLRSATKIQQNKRITLQQGSKARTIRPVLTKSYISMIRRARSERSHFRLVTDDKCFQKGIADYTRSLRERVKSKKAVQKGQSR
ncbi:MAG: GNAT family N-acetyltransferase [Bacteroidota bacterium]